MSQIERVHKETSQTSQNFLLCFGHITIKINVFGHFANSNERRRLFDDHRFEPRFGAFRIEWKRVDEKAHRDVDTISGYCKA